MKATYLKTTPVVRMPEYFGEDVLSWEPYVSNVRAGQVNHFENYVWAPKGATTTHPECWLLVAHGVCAPADKECELACGYSDSKVADQAAKHDLLEAGKLYVPDPK